MEGDPEVTGRWGASVVLLPDGAVAAALDRLTQGALAVAGPGHWATGSLGAAHLTVRALQRWGSPATDGQRRALERAVDGPVTIDLHGLRLTDTAVLATADDPDGAATRLRARYAAELGDEGWLEDRHLGPGGRDVWYATLLHVAAPVEAGLSTWVEERRDVAIGSIVFGAVAVCEWRFDGRRMVPVVIATVPLR